MSRRSRRVARDARRRSRGKDVWVLLRRARGRRPAKWRRVELVSADQFLSRETLKAARECYTTSMLDGVLIRPLKEAAP